jgi:predicted tellurium resistance membrane protein TerC
VPHTKKNPAGLKAHRVYLVCIRRKRLGDRRQVHSSHLAATIDFQLELEPVAFVERGHAATLDSRDVHERIGLAVVALNEAEALHRVEELDRPGCLLAGQLTLRRATRSGATRATRSSVTLARRAAVGDGHRLAVDLEVGRRDAAAAIDEGEAERLALCETGQAGLLDGRDVHEHILAAIVANDEAEALLAVEEFYDASAFTDNLGGHATATAACATTAEAAATAAAETAAAAAAAAEAIAAATAEAIATATEAITAAAETIATAAEAAVEAAAIAETVALVAPAPATIAAASFIETHALFVFPVRPTSISQPLRRTKDAGFRHQTNRATESCNAIRHRLRMNSSKLRHESHASCAAVASAAQTRSMSILTLLADPAAWAALATLIVMEVVLGIDNLVFISLLSNKLPEDQRAKVRRVGIGLALVLRLGLLSIIAWIAGLVQPVFDLGLTGSLDAHGVPAFETAFSVRDLILIAGGVFLLWKATTEIHHTIDHDEAGASEGAKGAAAISFGMAIVQILLLDMVFSIDSILTAIGMTDDLPVMVVAVVVAVGVMLLAATPLANFIARNPSVVMLALSFLLMIGAVLIADGFGVHVPKGYIYAAMAFSGVVEALNIAARRARAR